MELFVFLILAIWFLLSVLYELSAHSPFRVMMCVISGSLLLISVITIVFAGSETIHDDVGSLSSPPYGVVFHLVIHVENSA
jgi:hypothetical protein